MIAIFGFGPLEWTLFGVVAMFLFGRNLAGLGFYLGMFVVKFRSWIRRRPDDEDPGAGSRVPNAPRPPKLGG